MNPIVTTEIRSDAQAYASKRREGQFRVVCQKTVSWELSLIFFRGDNCEQNSKRKKKYKQRRKGLLYTSLRRGVEDGAVLGLIRPGMAWT